MPDNLNIAIIQSSGALNGVSERLEYLQDILNDIPVEIDLVILPELYQCGYNIDADVRTHAEEQSGPFAQVVAKLAQKHSFAILYGYSERAGDDVYNSAQCISKNGQAIGHYRKLLLPPGFEGDYFIAGSSADLFQLNDFTIGILICYDIEFPENARHLSMAGADLIAVPTALGDQWGVVSEKVTHTRAYENGVHIAYANHAGIENDLTYYGGSCIIGPDGKALARADSTPQIIKATLSMDAVTAARDRLPFHEHSRKLPWGKAT